MSRTATSTTPKPVPGARPRTSARDRSGSRPATAPTSSTSHRHTQHAPTSARTTRRPRPPRPDASPSIASPAHTTPTAPHSAPLQPDVQQPRRDHGRHREARRSAAPTA